MIAMWVLCNSSDPKLFWSNLRLKVSINMLIHLWSLVFERIKKEFLGVCRFNQKENPRIGLRQW